MKTHQYLNLKIRDGGEFFASIRRDAIVQINPVHVTKHLSGTPHTTTECLLYLVDGRVVSCTHAKHEVDAWLAEHVVEDGDGRMVHPPQPAADPVPVANGVKSSFGERMKLARMEAKKSAVEEPVVAPRPQREMMTSAAIGV